MAHSSPNNTGQRPERIQSGNTEHGNPIASSLRQLSAGTGFQIVNALGGSLTIAKDGADLGNPKNLTTMSHGDFRKLPRTPEVMAA